ncbi:MAG: hypothetical protein WCO86_11175 [Planctomycetota bacterium]
MQILTGPELSEPVSDGERLFVFHKFISVREFFGGTDPVQGMSVHSDMLDAEVLQRKLCWITEAESTVSGRATTTGPDWLQP